MVCVHCDFFFSPLITPVVKKGLDKYIFLVEIYLIYKRNTVDSAHRQTKAVFYHFMQFICKLRDFSEHVGEKRLVCNYRRGVSIVP